MCSVHSQFGRARVYVRARVHMEARVSPGGCTCVFVSKAEEECIGGGARLRVVRVSPTSLAPEPRASLTQ